MGSQGYCTSYFALCQVTTTNPFPSPVKQGLVSERSVLNIAMHFILFLSMLILLASPTLTINKWGVRSWSSLSLGTRTLQQQIVTFWGFGCTTYVRVVPKLTTVLLAEWFAVCWKTVIPSSSLTGSTASVRFVGLLMMGRWVGVLSVTARLGGSVSQGARVEPLGVRLLLGAPHDRVGFSRCKSYRSYLERATGHRGFQIW
jgi:hypothetical protein